MKDPVVTRRTEPPRDQDALAAGETGLAAVLSRSDFRRLWVGQIFSQLADKFYIVLMVFLIAQYWVPGDLGGGTPLAEAAAAIRINLESRVCSL